MTGSTESSASAGRAFGNWFSAAYVIMRLALYASASGCIAASSSTGWRVVRRRG